MNFMTTPRPEDMSQRVVVTGTATDSKYAQKT